MSKESDFIMNLIDQAPKDFDGDESSYIIDGVRNRSEKKKLNDHEILWSTFVGKPEGNDYKSFLNASLSEKTQILKNRASDTDDVLFRSKEWMRISGNPEAEEDYIPSVLEYANPFTRSLPNGNTMMPEDFR
jgi:hypothetical protein